ncbi:MAG TPA: hypothetical protein VMT35_10130 [Ignavibacteriaceae bacterium]|nr:hypothetical protein [Ignavibacteriaceae bacterium]
MKKIFKNFFNDGEPSPAPFKTWSVWYSVVLGNLFLIIILLYILTRTLE